ncbi:MAG: hypothetical protein ACRELS_19990 [Candidatus Rokuibacteriota bacterium]
MARLIVAAVLGALLWASGAVASDARAAVEAFLSRFSEAKLTSLVIEQTFTLYDPTGRSAQSSGAQRVSLKLPRRQRIEQTIEGQREVRLVVEDAVWIRRRDGKVHEAPRPATGRDTSHLLVPARRSAADMLAEWRALGIRDGITHVTRHNGREVTVIGAAAGDRESSAVWLDREYGVVRVITREKLPAPYGETLLDLTLSEHRPLVSGYYYPHREEWFASGKLLILIVTRSIVANPPLADALFDPVALGRER